MDLTVTLNLIVCLQGNRTGVHPSDLFLENGMNTCLLPEMHCFVKVIWVGKAG